MENMDRRPERLVLQASKNIHCAICVGNFRLTKSLIGRINWTSLFVPGNHGHLIVEAFRSAKISLSKVWKNMVLNIFGVQGDYNPIHNMVIGTFVAVGSRGNPCD